MQENDQNYYGFTTEKNAEYGICSDAIFVKKGTWGMIWRAAYKKINSFKSIIAHKKGMFMAYFFHNKRMNISNHQARTWNSIW